MLLSFAFYGRDDIGKYRASMPCGRLMIDSGAYTAASVGKPIDLREYAEFLTTWRGAIDHAVTLDVIGDPVATRRNTQWLHRRGHNVMPVFTRGDSLAEFDAMVRECGYVCVGGGVGMPKDVVIRRLSGLQRRAEELGGGIHALGVGNLNGLRKIRPYSADSSNVSGAFKFGYLLAYTRNNQQITLFPMSDRAKFRKKVRPHLSALKDLGVDLPPLIRSGRMPASANGARFALMQALSVAYVCADEDTTRYQVAVPHGVQDSPGTHMYSAITGPNEAVAVAKLDTAVHNPDWSVPLWDRYRDRHHRQCRQRRVAVSA
jgi:hypothetical protein